MTLKSPSPPSGASPIGRTTKASIACRPFGLLNPHSRDLARRRWRILVPLGGWLRGRVIHSSWLQPWHLDHQLGLGTAARGALLTLETPSFGDHLLLAKIEGIGNHTQLKSPFVDVFLHQRRPLLLRLEKLIQISLLLDQLLLHLHQIGGRWRRLRRRERDGSGKTLDSKRR